MCRNDSVTVALPSSTLTVILGTMWYGSWFLTDPTTVYVPRESKKPTVSSTSTPSPCRTGSLHARRACGKEQRRCQPQENHIFLPSHTVYGAACTNKNTLSLRRRAGLRPRTPGRVATD